VPNRRTLVTGDKGSDGPRGALFPRMSRNAGAEV
jgi:hypothetical protein